VLVGTGSNETRFTVHHEIIAKRSAFFRTARSERKEKSEPADLHEYKPETFEVYLYCLYHDATPKALLFEPVPPPDKESAPEIIENHRKQVSVARRVFSDSRFKELVDLYALADSLTDTITANIAIDEIRRFSNSFGHEPSAKVIKHAFRLTANPDGLRILLADYFIYGSSKISSCDLPKQFFNVVGERFLDAKKAGDILLTDTLPEFFRDVNGSDDWGDRVYYQDPESDEE
jgi:hypothetical protein